MANKFVIIKDLQKKFKKDSVIIREGEHGTTMYYILEGEVGVYKNEKFLAKLKRGDLFGEMALISPAPRTASVIALSDVVLLEINKKTFDVATSELSPWVLSLIKALVERLKRMDAIATHKQITILDFYDFLKIVGKYFRNRIPIEFVYDIYKNVYTISKDEVDEFISELLKEKKVALGYNTIEVIS